MRTFPCVYAQISKTKACKNHLFPEINLFKFHEIVRLEQIIKLRKLSTIYTLTKFFL